MLVFEGARAEGQQQPGSTTIESSTESSIVVPPWCNWIVNIPESINFQPVDSNGNEIADFVYNGTAQAIASTASAESYYVAGASGLTEQAELDNCSWFGSPEMGAGVSFSLSGSTFQAYGQGTESAPQNIRDTAMDIKLDDANPMILSRVFGASCSVNRFQVGETNLLLQGPDQIADIRLLGIQSMLVATNNFCSTVARYTMKIPAGLVPTYGDSRFTWRGPTITFTSVLGADDPGTMAN